VKAPVGVTAAVASQTAINLSWQDSTTNETGFQVQRCSGQGCANFAQVGQNLAANSVSFADVDLTPNTSYSYRVRAITATDSSAWSATATATTTGTVNTPAFTMVGAGEITSCTSVGAVQTANIIKGMLSDTSVVVFTAGNNLTDSVPRGMFQDCFGPKWGEFKDRTFFAIGDEDYWGGRGSSDVYSYLGSRTGPAGKGWFSFDRGNWHVIVLNGASWEQGTAALQAATGEMNSWLAADLASVPAGKCIMAISWERRVYTTGSGVLGVNMNMKQAASLLYGAKADLFVSAKDRIYARFPQTDNNGVPAADGFRQFIVGTGGRSLHAAVAPAGSPVEAQMGNNTPGASQGVIKFTLSDNSYEWEFIPTLAGGWTDKSAAPVSCHQ
jgi:hypothetical protein